MGMHDYDMVCALECMAKAQERQASALERIAKAHELLAGCVSVATNEKGVPLTLLAVGNLRASTDNMK